jgi:flagellar basal-body rod modification protein FlgD
MTVNSVSSTSAASSTTAGDAKKAYVNYDSFLRLLVAQLKNQDPTEPKDNAQYLGQLASFSSVEQGVNSNKKLDALIASIEQFRAGSLIGRTIKSADGSISGVVKAVVVGAEGSTAQLVSGQSVVLEPGITIS